jgi:hypothetical protein
MIKYGTKIMKHKNYKQNQALIEIIYSLTSQFILF